MVSQGFKNAFGALCGNGLTGVVRSIDQNEKPA
jgi:hypothetical protein